MPQIGQETHSVRTSFRISRRRFVRKTRHFETTPQIRCRVAVVAANSRGITKGICKGWGELTVVKNGATRRRPRGREKKWPGYRENQPAPISLTRNVESIEEGPKTLSDPPGATTISEEEVLLCGGLWEASAVQKPLLPSPHALL